MASKHLAPQLLYLSSGLDDIYIIKDANVENRTLLNVPTNAISRKAVPVTRSLLQEYTNTTFFFITLTATRKRAIFKAIGKT